METDKDIHNGTGLPSKIWSRHCNVLQHRGPAFLPQLQSQSATQFLSIVPADIKTGFLGDILFDCHLRGTFRETCFPGGLCWCVCECARVCVCVHVGVYVKACMCWYLLMDAVLGFNEAA